MTPDPAAQPALVANQAGAQRSAPSTALGIVLALTLYAALGAVSVLWLSDWGRHGPAFARRFGGEQATSLAIAAACGGALWLLRDQLMLAVLRGLARWQAQAARRRMVTVALALLGFARC